jgi:GntR family transcriptional repressor for pyruvate dehydrogenase complex
MEFQPIVSTKLYQQVINQIKSMIYSKTLKKGDKLPSERDMALMFGVSRTAIREALRSLEMLGLTESRQGEGTFIASSFPEYKMFEPLSLIFTLEDNAMELMDVRSMLEIECAGYAADFITPQELEKLGQYTQLLMGIHEGTITEEADHIYHSLIAKASHNTLLNYMYSSIHEVVSLHIVSMRQMILEDAANSETLASQHNSIYQAIFHNNRDQARQAMRVHMKFVHDQLCLKSKG